MAKFCSRCGSPVLESSQFCESCGARLSATQTNEQVQRVPSTQPSKQEGIMGTMKTVVKGLAICVGVIILIGVIAAFVFGMGHGVASTSNTLATVVITSSPSGAQIYMDGQWRGTTPTTLNDVTPGTHNLKLSLSGYDDYTTQGDLTAGSTSNVNAVLSRSQNPTIVATLPTVTTANPTVTTTANPTVTTNPEASVEVLKKVGEVGIISPTQVTVFTAKRTGSSVLVDAEIANLGSDSMYVTVGSFSMSDSAGNRYDPAMYMGSDAMDMYKELYQNQKTRGKILFSIPSTATGLKIYYDAGSLVTGTKLICWVL